MLVGFGAAGSGSWWLGSTPSWWGRGKLVQGLLPLLTPTVDGNFVESNSVQIEDLVQGELVDFIDHLRFIVGKIRRVVDRSCNTASECSQCPLTTALREVVHFPTKSGR